MATMPTSTAPARHDRAISVVVGCAVFVALVSILLAALSIIRSTQSASTALWDKVAYPLMFLLAGVFCVGLLSGIAILLRSRDGARAGMAARSPTSGDSTGPTNGEISDATRSLLGLIQAIPHPTADRVLVDPAAPRVDPATADARWAEVVGLLRELRDNSLLTEAQRIEKRAKLAADELQESRTHIRELLHNGQFVGARRAVDELRRRYPELSGLDELSAEVEQARARAEAEDIAVFTRRVEELMSISAWDPAADTARQLQERHPENAVALKLLQRVSRDRDLFNNEQRRRKYGEIQRFIERRRWRDAASHAHVFLAAYPTSTDAETLRAHLPTIVNNAEIEERQDLEAQITDLAKHARYIEAYNLSRYVIDRYPNSPQADALKLQLARLKELAHDPDAAPARIRVDD